ncbi:dsDNA nuclease domain-containing protein [Bradyrhizobium brasilense]|uniref:dsDNA nuclease domain-containing protein n=1 Tax=Bradyrhizobium brasilense TaxID=1419277 RepID=UPI0024B1B0DB|nr:dsDNA nuclease domain-containing protein [Bradyrhizobium australafricanum]WFU34874.1 dsDNA nuclease domain-containing protein [Bradyrhizobium australafricanum]
MVGRYFWITMSNSSPTDERSKPKKHSTKKSLVSAPPTPIDVFNDSDPGDATQRNFRYQHAFGVILLVAGKMGNRPYVAIWCEQHEDLLAERSDGTFDGYQIKTSRPENGPWKLNDLELIKTIGRFTGLVREFGNAINEVFFVSNTECDSIGKEATNDRRRSLCPRLFLEHVQSCSAPSEINSVFSLTFQNLQAECGCSEAVLFQTLHKMNIVLGPSRSEFEAAISHEHIAQLDQCKELNADQLDAFRDYLIGVVYRASSLQTGDPIRHLRPLINGGDIDPRLANKRLPVESLVIYAAQSQGPHVFQYVGESLIELGKLGRSTVLKQKLTAGGLSDQIDYMAERERSAERHLLEDVQRRPERYPELMKQIEQVVLGECREAHLRARQTSAPYGPAMLIDVQNRLRKIAREETALIGDHTYECLIGMVGLLTRECVVWWSPSFPIEGD